MQDSKKSQEEDRKMVAQDLVLFAANYVRLIDTLIDDVRLDMQTTIGDAMAQLSKINMTSGKQKDKAFEKAVGAKIVVRDHEEKKQIIEETQLQQSDEHVRSAESEFKKKISSLNQLDARIQKIMFTMIGALSADDVIGQRIVHLKYAVNALSDELRGIALNFDEKFVKSEIQSLNQDLLHKVYKSYSMEEEKEIFLKVYDKAPEPLK